jgi:hypothetical protein
VTRNVRYERQIDERQLGRIEQMQPGPLTLPMQAYGPRPVEWTQARTPVWVWVHFPDGRPAERRQGYVKGSNDRIVVAWVDGPGGGWEITVWRNAVTHRRTQNSPSPNP